MIFFIFSMAYITQPDFSEPGSPINSPNVGGGPRSGPSAATGCYTPMNASQPADRLPQGKCFLRLSGNALPELLGEPDEKSFGAADVAEPIRVFVLDHFADELRAALPEPGERLVDVVHSEHDA